MLERKSEIVCFILCDLCHWQKDPAITLRSWRQRTCLVLNTISLGRNSLFRLYFCLYNSITWYLHTCIRHRFPSSYLYITVKLCTQEDDHVETRGGPDTFYICPCWYRYPHSPTTSTWSGVLVLRVYVPCIPSVNNGTRTVSLKRVIRNEIIRTTHIHVYLIRIFYFLFYILNSITLPRFFMETFYRSYDAVVAVTGVVSAFCLWFW